MRAAEVIDRLVRVEGSTRAVGLLRLLVGLLLWSEYANLLAPFKWEKLADAPAALAIFLGSTLLVLGVASRPAALVVGALQCFFVLYGPKEPWQHHHTWLLAITTLLLGFMPCGRSFSVERWVRRAPEWGPLWATHLVRLQLSVMYLLAAVDKMTIGFLSGDRLQMIFADKYFGAEVPPIPLYEPLVAVAAVVTVFIEAFLAVALWIPRARPLAFALALVLHALFYLLIPVGTFSVTTIAMWLVVFRHDQVHRAIDRLVERTPAPGV